VKLIFYLVGVRSSLDFFSSGYYSLKLKLQEQTGVISSRGSFLSSCEEEASLNFDVRKMSINY